jgi:hypothetical protein
VLSSMVSERVLGHTGLMLAKYVHDSSNRAGHTWYDCASQAFSAAPAIARAQTVPSMQGR